jgi:hypothetical protein
MELANTNKFAFLVYFSKKIMHAPRRRVLFLGLFLGRGRRARSKAAGSQCVRA